MTNEFSCVKIFFGKAVLKMNDFLMNFRTSKEKRINRRILEDMKDFHEIVVLCLGNYEDTLSPFLTFASKVGTILKVNHFPVYGDMTNPILIDKKSVTPLLEEITRNHPNSFVLVIMTSVSDSKKALGNLYYENTPYKIEDLKVGNAKIQLCGSFGNGSTPKKTYEKYIENGLSLSKVNETATDIALTLMKIMNQKQEKNTFHEENTLCLKNEHRK